MFKIKQLIALYVGIILSTNGWTQCENWEWAKNASGSSDGFESAIATDPFGNVFSAGIFDSTMFVIETDTFWNSGQDSMWDIYLAKYDQDGNYLWALQGLDSGWDHVQAVVSDLAGNALIIGSFCSCDTFVFGTDTLDPVGNNPFFLIKIDPNGNVLWSKSFGALGYNYPGGSMDGLATDANGNVFISGFFGNDTFLVDNDTLFRNVALTHQLFVCKFDPSGNVVWLESAYAEGEHNSPLAVDPFGNVYVAASVKNDTVFFGNDVLVNHGSGTRDIALLKFDNDGNPVWGKIHGGLNMDEPLGIASDATGNIFFTGYFLSSSMDFGQYTITQNGNLNMFLAKLQPDGNYAWAQQSSCSSQAAGWGLAINSEGACYVHGPYDCQMMSFGSFTVSNAGGWDSYIVKFDTDGTPVWATGIGNTGGETGGMIAVDPFDNIFIQSHTSSTTLDLGSITLNYIGNNLYDVYVAKLSKFQISVDITDSYCGQSDGSATVNVTGGNSPYSYQWSNGDSTALNDSLPSGTYAVTVSDANDCKAYATIMINDQDGPTLSANQTDISCDGGTNGAVDISVTGGATPYSYIWSNGETTQDISGLVAGPYDVVITDNNGCIVNGNYIIAEPDPMIFSINSQQPTCQNSDGIVSAIVIGGTAPFSYQWSNGGTDASISGLSAGIYILTVTDNNNCTDSVAVPISDVTGPSIVIDSIVDAGCGSNNGAIYIDVTSNSLPFTYNWSNNSTFEDQLAVSAGIYYLTVTDGNGCKSTAVVTVNTNPVSDPICLVTVDTSIDRNVVVWEKIQTSGIESFKIYRESTQQGVYQLAGSVPFDSLSIFVDSVADPTVKSWRYKISILDSCGNESTLSTHHKTIHLNINLGLGNTINLIWDQYEGFTFSSYYINRWSLAFGWELIDSVASNVTSYTDQNPPGGDLYYYVSVKPPSTCVATRSVNYHSSRSNEPPSVNTGLYLQGSNDQSFSIFPNPTRGSFTLSSLGRINTPITLLIENLAGQVMFDSHFNPGDKRFVKSIDLSHAPKGMYFIIILTEGEVLTNKLIVN